MSRIKRIIMFVLIICFMSSLAIAKGPIALRMGTGGPTGNYFAMGNDIQSYCGEVIVDDKGVETEFEIMNSGGSVANIEGMNNKLYTLGIAQEDVLQYMAKQNSRTVNVNRMKIISGLHIETIHLLIPKTFVPTSNAPAPKPLSAWDKAKIKMGLKDKKVTKSAPIMKISLAALAGQTVGAWGGSTVSAKALKYFMNVDFTIKELSEAERTTTTLPLIIVGGMPYKPVEEYLKTGKYNLVSLDYETIKNQAQFYVSTGANYTIEGVTYSSSTIGVRALLLGKSFRKESRNKNMIKLAQCISDNLADLADDPDTNPNWTSVYELEENGQQTNWSYFPVN